MFRYSLRELLWLTLVVAVVSAWCVEAARARQWQQRAEVAAGQLEAENQKLKAKIGELVMQNEQLKKLRAYAQRLRSADTSVITERNLDQYRKGSK